MFRNTISRYDMLVQNYQSSLAPVRLFQPIKEEIKYEVETNRMTDIKEIEKEQKKVREAIIEKNIKIKKVIEDVEIEDVEKDNNIILNTSLTSLLNGFLSTKEKNKYIKANADNFKSLQPNEQKSLFRIYLTYIN